MDLLEMLRKSLGVFSTTDELDEYYQNFIDMAKSDLASEDISSDVLDTDIGKTTIVFYAKLLVEDKDISTNQTLTFLRNKLSSITKGNRYEDAESEEGEE